MPASAIVAYRGEPGSARRANLDAVLAWLARTPELEVIVVEQDACPRLAPPLAHPGARVLFAFNAGPFNKAWALNVGARAASGDVLLPGDAGLLVPGGLVPAAALCAREAQVVKPYRQVVDLTSDETDRVLAGGIDAAPRELPASRFDRTAVGERIVLCGGWFAIRRDAWAALGGLDERFVGRGGEDEAMTIKVERARLATFELEPGPAFRLWHPRPPSSATGHGLDASNQALLADYGRYDDATLARLQEVGYQICGRRDKYRPAMR